MLALRFTSFLVYVCVLASETNVKFPLSIKALSEKSRKLIVFLLYCCFEEIDL